MLSKEFTKYEMTINNDFFENEISSNNKNNNCYLNKKRKISKDNDSNSINEDTNYTNININLNLNKNIVNNTEPNNNKEYDDKVLYIPCEDGTIKVIELSNESFVKKFFH